MTGVFQFELPPPKSWSDFEELCADTFQEEWRDRALVRYGRAGQQQHGVDIVGRDGALWPIGIQCKKKSLWPVRSVSVEELDDEVDKAKNFKPTLKAFFLVSIVFDDKLLQDRANELTENHKKLGLFPVHVFGWSEVLRRATRHQVVAEKHFGAFSRTVSSPLLATWSTAEGRLLIDDSELRIAIRELIHDFAEYPTGRLVIRQNESELLQFKINELRAGVEQSLANREEVLRHRDALKKYRTREHRASAEVSLLLSHKILSYLVEAAWDDKSPLLVRSIVERTLDLDSAIVTGLEKVRIYPPGSSADPIAIFMKKSDIQTIVEHQADLHRRFPKLKTDNVMEMPDSIKLGYAVPKVVSAIISAVEHGAELSKLEQMSWLDIHSWKYTY